MKKDTTMFRMVIALALIIFLALFVALYMKVQRFEDYMEQISDQEDEVEYQEDDEPIEYYRTTVTQPVVTTTFNVTTTTYITSITKDDSSSYSNTSSSYTDYELELLAHLINAEASCYLDEGTWRNCSDEWQCYVACVALNRVESSKSYYPDTLEEVIFQKNQYACTVDGNFEKTPTERAYANAKRVLEGYRPVPRDVLIQCENCIGTLWQKVGNTYFCYDN